MTDRPRIAVALSRPDSELKRAARQRYVTALERAGAEVIPVSPGDEAPRSFDGLCLTGGEDIEPSRYGAADEGCEVPDPERDSVELALLDRARSLGVPVLGICRGFQVLNVGLGGTLLQHVEGHRPGEPSGFIEHTVVAAAGSRLAQATTERAHRVNSRHHQAVSEDRLAPGLVPTVIVDDIVEAFEASDGSWVVGIQWHPERANEVDPAAVRIFEAFVRAAERVPAR